MRRLAWWETGFCAALLAFALGLKARWAIFLAAGAAILGVVSLLLRRRALRRVSAVLLGLAAGLGWAAGEWAARMRPLDAWDGRETALWAQAADYTRGSAYGTATEVYLQLDGRDCRAVLYCRDDPALTPGDWLGGTLRLARTEGGAYAARGCDFQAETVGAVKVRRCADRPLSALPAVAAEHLRANLQAALPGEAGGFAAALLTGDQSGLSPAFLQQMSLSGTRHLVAVSGMHLSILAGALALALGGRRRLAAILGLPLVWCFALVAGMRPSAARAAVMQSFLLLAPLLRRENDPPTSVLTALTLILLPNPRAILDVGLQLSFAAVAGVYLFAERILLWMEGRWYAALCRRARWLGALVKAVLGGTAASLAVLPMTLPLSLLHFGSVSLAAPLAGAILAPLIPICFLLALATGLTAWTPLGMVLSWGIAACMAVIRWVAGLPLAAVPAGSGYFLCFFLAVFLFALHGAASRRPCSVWVRCGCLLSLFAVCWLLESAEYDRAALSVTLLDVGQGQCVYLESKGHGAMYDCGGRGDAALQAALLLESRGKLDFLAVSHYDEDHAGGVAVLLRTVPVDTIFLPATADARGVQTGILEAAEATGCRVVFVQEDLSVALGAAEARLFAPMEAVADNAGSMAAHIRAGDFDVLLTGDLSAAAETRLLMRQEIPDLEVLVAGHHGAAGSTGAALLRHLKPEVALISVGADNPFGHPSPETLSRLEKSGAAVYRTDQCGTITVRR